MYNYTSLYISINIYIIYIYIYYTYHTCIESQWCFLSIQPKHPITGTLSNENMRSIHEIEYQRSDNAKENYDKLCVLVWVSYFFGANPSVAAQSFCPIPGRHLTCFVPPIFVTVSRCKTTISKTSFLCSCGFV